MAHPTHISLVIANQFSLFGYAVAAELFRYANAELGHVEYQTRAVSTGPGTVKCSNGTEINVSAGLLESPEPNAIILCSNARADHHTYPPKLVGWLRSSHRRGTPICALGSAVWAVAEAGLLDNDTCAAHWSEISALRLKFPNVTFTRKPFTTANRVWVCSGGDSVADMLLHFLGRRHGPEFSAKLRRILILKPNLADSDPGDLMFHANASDMELVGERFLAIVEAAIEKPLSISKICIGLKISHRTLNRHCHTLFGQSPKEVYLDARLRQARNLLTGTTLAIGDVAAACGFSTPGHFAQVFLERQGRTPSAFRTFRRTER
ncbi:MAG: helix-turn-helix domain-containing protein [Albidovulum sp.]